LKTTPLHGEHVALGARMAEFGGWDMPIQYEGILAEHFHTRKAVSVFDICHMGEFILDTDDSRSGLDRIVTQNISTMPVGSCRYGFMLNDNGGIIDDLIVYRLEKLSWMLVVNAATIAGDEANIRKNLTGKYRFKNVSGVTGKLDVQGPLSLETLKPIAGDRIEKLGYYTFTEFDLFGSNAIISRTGYTGELGYEIYGPNENIVKLWNLLLKDPRVKPAGLGARDTLRLEMGYPLYGQDIDINHTPVAAGLDKFVDLSKDFTGKSALLAEKKSGPKERLIYFKADSRRSPRHGFGIYSGTSRIGTVTSGSFSPSLSAGIGIGYVSGAYPVGTSVIVKDGQTEIPAVVVDKPFYKRSFSRERSEASSS